MPYAAPRFCSRPGCAAAATARGFCEAHARPAPTTYPREIRASASAPAPRSSDYGRDWQRLRLWFLRRHPLCQAPGCAAPASQVDHIIPHAGRKDPRFRDPSNLQALCTSCHSRKTARDRKAGLTRPSSGTPRR